MKTAFAFGSIILALSSCVSPPITEQKLIGTWRITAAIQYHEDGSKKLVEMPSDMEVTFTSDRRELWSDPGGPPRAVARWHLDGNDLVFTIISKPKDMHLPSTPQRERIARLTDTELVFTDGKTGGKWKRVR